MKNINHIIYLAKTYKCKNYVNKIRTILTDEMLHNICTISSLCLNLKGDIAEVGVWIGSVGIIFGEIFKHKNIYLFDTFTGIPYSNEFDNIHKAGDFGYKDRNPLNFSSFEEVKETLSKYNNISIHKGIFPHETCKFIYNKKFSLVHLDVDVYKSYKESLDFFYPRMVDNGLILLDDYGISSCEGATKAINEFCNYNNVELKNFNNLFFIQK